MDEQIEAALRHGIEDLHVYGRELPIKAAMSLLRLLAIVRRDHPGKVWATLDGEKRLE